jgi:hypothetical protein
MTAMTTDQPRLAADPREWTPDQLMMLMAEAIEARDLEAVPHLIVLLALKDPHQAEVVYESMMAVLASRREKRSDGRGEE